MERSIRAAKRQKPGDQPDQALGAKKKAKVQEITKSSDAVISKATSSRSPKVNKTLSRKGGKVEIHTKKTLTNKAGSINNNVKLIEKEMVKSVTGAGQAESSQQQLASESENEEDQDLDHVKYSVADSEDEFTDDEGDDPDESERPLEENSEYGSDQDDCSFVSGSEVILKPPTKPGKDEYTEDIKSLTKHLAFHSYVQSLVTENVKQALKQQPKQPSAVAGKVVKRVVNNPKSPSDTTIYAPALNLTPERVNRNPTIQDPNCVVQKISEFVEGIQIENERSKQSSPSNNVVPTIVGQSSPTQGGGDCQPDQVMPGKSGNEATQNWLDQV